MSWARALLFNVAILALAAAVGGPEQASLAALKKHQEAPVQDRSEVAAVATALPAADNRAVRGGFEQVGIASWYGPRHHGRQTASGEIFDMHKMTAAHRSLPLGTRVRVTNLDNGRAVDVKINDRGPYIDGRVIDLSKGAAQALDMTRAGLAPVKVESIAAAPVRTASRARMAAEFYN